MCKILIDRYILGILLKTNLGIRDINKREYYHRYDTVGRYLQLQPHPATNLEPVMTVRAEK